MDIEAHLRRTWDVYTARWQDAVVVSILPLALLLAIPVVVVGVYLIIGLMVAASVLVFVAMAASGVSNATVWSIVIIAILALVAGFLLILLVLPVVILSFIIRSCVNPTLAQMMAGGKGGYRDSGRSCARTGPSSSSPTSSSTRRCSCLWASSSSPWSCWA